MKKAYEHLFLMNQGFDQVARSLKELATYSAMRPDEIAQFAHLAEETRSATNSHLLDVLAAIEIARAGGCLGSARLASERKGRVGRRQPDGPRRERPEDALGAALQVRKPFRTSSTVGRNPHYDGVGIKASTDRAPRHDHKAHAERGIEWANPPSAEWHICREETEAVILAWSLY